MWPHSTLRDVYLRDGLGLATTHQMIGSRNRSLGLTAASHYYQCSEQSSYGNGISVTKACSSQPYETKWSPDPSIIDRFINQI